ncbi:MAG: hypothetical protein ACFFB0_18665 [Promethearchaeota archaeon]
MKTYNRIQDHGASIKGNSREIAHLFYNFNKIPPIIGMIVADQFGNILMVIDYENTPEGKYGSIKSYLSGNNENLLELDLISMYFSSFKVFAAQTNIQNLSNLEIHGSNIKVQLYFPLNKYILIIFLHSKVDLNLKEKEQIVQYFKEILTKYSYEFQHFNASPSRKTLKMLENKGKIFLKRLNRTYIQAFHHHYLKKHQILEMLMSKISPTIEEVLAEYLKGIPKDFINDMSRELKNKIHDKMCDFKIS